MKRNISIFLILIICFSLFSCSKKEVYNDSTPCSDLADKVKEQFSIDLGYESYDADFIKYNFENASLCDDYGLRYSSRSSDIDEFGILHASDEGSAQKLLSSAEKYLEELKKDKKAFIESYAPKEASKLDNARVKRFGNYVAYAILSDDDSEIFFDTVEKMLRK